MDFVAASSKLAFVLDQLSQYPGLKKEGEGSTFVLCPYHSENTPSARIFHSQESKSPGYLKCYGCGGKGNWDTIAPLLGLKPFVRQKPADEFANLSMLELADRHKKSKDTQEEIEFSPLPKGKKWRGIKTNLLRALGAKICRIKHPEYGWLKPKIYLPVFVNDKLRGYVKARFRKHEEYPSYINSNGPWSKTHGLFPFDFAIKLARKIGSETVVLVEGPRDALRLLQAGIPAMCILGTQSWAANKSKILELAGIETVILLMDGDCAGIDASEKLIAKLESMFTVIELKLWSMKGSPYKDFAHKKDPSKAAKKAGVSLWDPGNCPDWILSKIKSKYFA